MAQWGWEVKTIIRDAGGIGDRCDVREFGDLNELQAFVRDCGYSIVLGPAREDTVSDLVRNRGPEYAGVTWEITIYNYYLE